MGNQVPDIIICFISISTIGVIYLVSNLLRDLLGGNDSNNTTISLSKLIDQQAIEYGWILKFVVNSFGYACVFVPMLLTYQYTQRVKYLERCGSKNGIIPKTITLCFGGRLNEPQEKGEALLGVQASVASSSSVSSNMRAGSTRDAILMVYCFFGLMISYLTWGLLQEKIMTQEYHRVDSNGIEHRTHYKDSQFLVFANRVLAFFMALIYLHLKRGTIARHRAPLYKYSYASFSNIMSAWFQYEALKFVNFPTQVLAKSCKLIPVMLMGKIVLRAKYEFYEYIIAIMISVGMMFFLLGSSGTAQAYTGSSIANLTGVLLLTLYMTCDSFTSNWQSELFKTYDMTTIQMMCGVNLFSTLFTSVSLSLQGGFTDSIVFAMEHPKFLVDCVVLSISSSFGQLFIFYTIAKFGPVVFTIIMTLRQAIAILLSCMVYNHVITNLGILGVTIVFFSIFLRIYCSQRLKLIRRRSEPGNPRTSGV